jgi:hypothetical protein
MAAGVLVDDGVEELGLDHRVLDDGVEPALLGELGIGRRIELASKSARLSATTSKNWSEKPPPEYCVLRPTNLPGWSARSCRRVCMPAMA